MDVAKGTRGCLSGGILKTKRDSPSACVSLAGSPVTGYNTLLCIHTLAIKDISDLLNTGLDDETLRICVQLLEAGVNPEALAMVVQELRRETMALRV